MTMRPEDILMPTPAGVCCKRGGFYIDPTRPVEKALITHGHSDHARAGHGAVLATQETLDLMRLRYGENFAGATQAIGYGETVTLDGARVTFHPAGHVLGSAQIAVEVQRAAHRRRRRLQGRRRSDLRAVRTGRRAMSSSPRRRSACRCSATASPTARSPSSCIRRAVSRARAPRRRLFARQGAAGDRADPQGRLRPADLSARRDGDDHALLRRPRHRAGRVASRCATPRRPSLPARSRSARRRRCRSCGRGAFPIR